MSLKSSGKRKPLLHDASIVSRVQMCLEASAGKAIEFGFILRQLQAKYPEYKRRKQGPFRQLVKQALRILNQDIEPQNTGETVEPDVQGEEVNTPKKANLMSGLLNNMYKKVKKPRQTNGRAGGGYAISISSDESVDNPAAEQNNASQSCRASMNSSSRSSINSLNLDVVLSPMSEVPSACQSVIAGQKRSENSPSDESSPAKKLMTHHRRSLDEEKSLDECALSPNEAVENSVNKEHNKRGKITENSARNFKKGIKLEIPVVKFHHLGGIEKVLKELCHILIHIKSPDIYNTLGVVPPKGILIHGTSGCGKTRLAYAIAGQLQIPIINVPTTELIAGVSGESEERIRDIFEQAVAASPCVLFLDNVEAISGNRLHAQKGMERRMVSQLISSIDSLTHNKSNVLIIGATTRPDSIDSALRRSGRFDHEIAIPIPNRKERRDILRILCDGLQIEPNFDYDMIAELTPGYVGADISALVTRASLIAVKNKFLEQLYISKGYPPLQENADLEIVEERSTSNENSNSSSSFKDYPSRPHDPMAMNIDNNEEEEERIDANEPTDNIPPIEPNVIMIDDGPNRILRNIWKPTLNEMIVWLTSPAEKINMDNFQLTFKDFQAAIKVLIPSAKREGFITVPDISWDDVGSLRDIQEELRLAILAPVKFSNEMSRLGLTSPSGVLLCGPPGCGKTLIAKAIANEAGINFLSVKGPELMNMYVGESERAVRDCFQRARNSAPCVIFFDEFDSLCPKRAEAHEGGSGVRVVNQLLTEMDGIEERKGVYLMAASNRPDIIDPAILRPGRLDIILYVGLPNEKDRMDILNATTKNRTRPVLSEDVNFAELAKRTEKFTGADLSGLVRKAAMEALKDAIENKPDLERIKVSMKHFAEALQLVRPSISDQDLMVYEKMREKYAAPRYAA